MSRNRFDPHFVKTIRKDTIQENMLCLPKKFVSMYGESLAERVHVKLPCGTKWEMKLCYHHGNVWLKKKGWSKFAAHYSIVEGHILSFRYKGNSQFRAVIFDATNMEIDYPPLDVSVKDERVEIFEDSETQRRKIPLTPCSRPQKRARTSHGDDSRSGIEENSTKEKSKAARHQIIAQANGDSPIVCAGNFKTYNQKITKSMNKNERMTAIEKSRAFTSDRPYFSVVMHPYYLRSSLLNIKAWFARKHLKCESGEGILKLPNKSMIWAVKYNCVTLNNSNLIARFFRGWKEFAIENRLKIGDVCVFVLLRSKNISFEVVIFRNKKKVRNKKISSNSGSNVQKQNESFAVIQKSSIESSGFRNYFRPAIDNFGKKLLSLAERTRLLERACFDSDKPFFKQVIQPSHIGLRGYIPVPSNFVGDHIESPSGNVVLRVPNSEEIWHARLRLRFFKSTRRSTTEICSGWREFAECNELKLRDVVILELLNGTEISFQVSIVQAPPNATC